MKQQRARKVVSDSPGLVDCATRIVNSVLNLPDGQVKYFKEFNRLPPPPTAVVSAPATVPPTPEVLQRDAAELAVLADEGVE